MCPTAHRPKKLVEPDEDVDSTMRDVDFGDPRGHDGVDIVELKRQLVNAGNRAKADKIRDLRIGAGGQATDRAHQAAKQGGIVWVHESPNRAFCAATS